MCVCYMSYDATSIGYYITYYDNMFSMSYPRPMRKFQCNPSVLAGKDAKKLVLDYYYC